MSLILNGGLSLLAPSFEKFVRSPSKKKIRSIPFEKKRTFLDIKKLNNQNTRFSKANHHSKVNN